MALAIVALNLFKYCPVCQTFKRICSSVHIGGTILGSDTSQRCWAQIDVGPADAWLLSFKNPNLTVEPQG